ncbi:MAG TPA: hypothetical protein VN256_05050 [Pyrinomonadaceae bacterium]|nr:hypothetical protein [Pyrinomonadaceae bacterium]
MKKTVYASLLMVLALGGFLYAGALNRAAGRIDEGSEAGAPPAERWEYCTVSKAGYTASNRGGTYWISYFRDTGVDIVEVEERASEQQGAAVVKAIARLGSDGWEMVGQADLPVKTGRLEALYFKRRKP